MYKSTSILQECKKKKLFTYSMYYQGRGPTSFEFVQSHTLARGVRGHATLKKNFS